MSYSFLLVDNRTAVVPRLMTCNRVWLSCMHVPGCTQQTRIVLLDLSSKHMLVSDFG